MEEAGWETYWVLPLLLGLLTPLLLYTLLDLPLAHSFKYCAQVDNRQGGQVLVKVYDRGGFVAEPADATPLKWFQKKKSPFKVTALWAEVQKLCLGSRIEHQT